MNPDDSPAGTRDSRPYSPPAAKDLPISRLRAGEIITGAGALVLAILMFAVPWYGSGGMGRTAGVLGGAASVDGWDALNTLRWLMLATIIAGLALVYFQATRAAPALPVSLSAIVTVLAVLTTLGLIYRVLISVPGPDSLISAQAGAYLGLACSLVMIYGGYRSMRQEWPQPDPERSAAIPTVDLEQVH